MRFQCNPPDCNSTNPGRIPDQSMSLLSADFAGRVNLPAAQRIAVGVIPLTVGGNQGARRG
jgi:hypothetical protein